MENIPLEELRELLELFRFYLGLVLETLTFVLGMTGAVAAYSIKDGRPETRVYAMLVPCALCLFIGVGFLVGVYPAWELKVRVDQLARTLAFGLAPHTIALPWSLGVCGILLIGVGATLPLMARRLKLPSTDVSDSSINDRRLTSKS